MTTPVPAPAPKRGIFQGRNLLYIAGGVLVLCVACVVVANIITNTPAGRASSTERALAALTEAATKLTPAPSNTPKPSDSPEPTATQAPPTETAGPTDTPLPSDTPEPTETATALPEPVQYSGTGDQIIELENPFGIAVAHIVGNKGGRFFSVGALDADNQTIASLVIATDPYDGYRPIDFKDGQKTVRLEVQAIGGWTIDILPLEAAHRFEVPGSYAGSGDDVVIMDGGKPDTAQVTGNKGSRFFSITTYGTDGNIDSIVISTDPYDGKVLMSPAAKVLDVQAIGDWTIDVVTK